MLELDALLEDWAIADVPRSRTACARIDAMRPDEHAAAAEQLLTQGLARPSEDPSGLREVVAALAHATLAGVPHEQAREPIAPPNMDERPGGGYVPLNETLGGDVLRRLLGKPEAGS